MPSLYSFLTFTLLGVQTVLAATNIGSYSGIAGWRRNDVEKVYYQDDQGQIFQQELDPNGGPVGNRTGPLPLGNYPAIFDSALAVVQFANAQEVRPHFFYFLFFFFLIFFGRLLHSLFPSCPVLTSQKPKSPGKGKEGRLQKENQKK